MWQEFMCYFFWYLFCIFKIIRITDLLESEPFRRQIRKVVNTHTFERRTFTFTTLRHIPFLVPSHFMSWETNSQFGCINIEFMSTKIHSDIKWNWSLKSAMKILGFNKYQADKKYTSIQFAWFLHFRPSWFFIFIGK